jgi:hypothetical protein
MLVLEMVFVLKANVYVIKIMRELTAAYQNAKMIVLVKVFVIRTVNAFVIWVISEMTALLKPA